MSTLMNGALRLDGPQGLGLIRAQGEEAAKFLHSQLTQDFALLGKDQARLAGFCTAKGRLLATMIGWKRSADDILLALPAELLPSTLKRLSMFVMRAKCKLSDVSADFQLWGMAGAEASVALGSSAPQSTWALAAFNEGQVLRLPGFEGQARYLLALPAGAAAPALPVLSEAQWQWLELQSGFSWVRSATVEQFVPQMINLELLDGVNFKKGCYPGQEIVARSQYRGTIKRRTFLFDTDGAPSIGQEIFHSSDAEQPAGLVAGSAPAPHGGHSLLAEVKMALLDSGSWHLGAPGGPVLQLRTLPYAVDVDVTE